MASNPLCWELNSDPPQELEGLCISAAPCGVLRLNWIQETTRGPQLSPRSQQEQDKQDCNVACHQGKTDPHSLCCFQRKQRWHSWQKHLKGVFACPSMNILDLWLCARKGSWDSRADSQTEPLQLGGQPQRAELSPGTTCALPNGTGAGRWGLRVQGAAGGEGSECQAREFGLEEKAIRRSVPIRNGS